MANGEYNKAVPRARGVADQKIRAAEGYQFKRINEAEGDVTAFNAVLEQFVKAPEVTRARIYLETLGDVLPQAGQSVIVDESVQQILPMLPFPSRPVEGRQVEGSQCASMRSLSRVAVIVIGFVLFLCVYTVNQTEQVIITQFGKTRRRPHY